MSSPQAASRYEVRLLDKNDSPAMRELFREIFSQDLGQAFWNWKYLHEDSCAVGVFSEGVLVGHYGGLVANIRYKGKDARAVQIVDVMVKSTQRQAVRRQSPFYLAGSYFLEHFIGYHKPNLLGYGFPSDRHMLLAEHMRFYAPVGKMWEINWDVSTAKAGSSLLHKTISLDASNVVDYEHKLELLWRQLARDLETGIVVRKDARHLTRRYLQHPDKEYKMYLVLQRFTAKPLGLFVLKQEAERVLLMDYVGPFANLRLVLQEAILQTRRAGKAMLSTWCSEVFTEKFRIHATSVNALPITTPANIWTDGPAPEELRNCWWLMPGDTDYL